MIAAAQMAPVRFVNVLGPWLALACFAILSLAAFLHWRRTRHWCLLALTAGSILVTFSGLATRITLAVLIFGRWHDLDTLRFVQSFAHWWIWFDIAGAAIAVFGGIGAIHWAIQLKSPGNRGEAEPKD